MKMEKSLSISFKYWCIWAIAILPDAIRKFEHLFPSTQNCYIYVLCLLEYGGRKLTLSILSSRKDSVQQFYLGSHELLFFCYIFTLMNINIYFHFSLCLVVIHWYADTSSYCSFSSHGGWIWYLKSILIKTNCRFVCMSDCLSVCLFGFANLFCLKSERHETRHVGPLGTWEGFRMNRFFKFNL